LFALALVALYHHLPFTLFAGALVNQMPSVGVAAVRGGAPRIGEGLSGRFSASGMESVGICKLEIFVSPSVNCISSTISWWWVSVQFFLGEQFL